MLTYKVDSRLPIADHWLFPFLCHFHTWIEHDISSLLLFVQEARFGGTTGFGAPLVLKAPLEKATNVAKKMTPRKKQLASKVKKKSQAKK